MWKSKTSSNFEWCGGWNNGVMGSWTTWFLDFNKRSAWNKRDGAKFGPFLINVVVEITELWLENSQKINCRDVKSIWEGRVSASDAHLILKFWGAALIRGMHLKEVGAHFKVREIIHMKFQNFVILSFQVTINNCHYDIYPYVFHNYYIFPLFFHCIRKGFEK